MPVEFQLYPAHTLASSPEIVADSPGAYIFMLGNAESHVNAALRSAAAPVPTFSAWPLLYVGATGDNLRVRIGHHLGHDSRVSSFRQSVGLILGGELGLDLLPIDGKRYFCFQNEAPLTDWMHSNTIVGICSSLAAFEIEKRFFVSEAGLFNIAGRPATPFTRRLVQLRRSISGSGLLAGCSARSESQKGTGASTTGA